MQADAGRAAVVMRLTGRPVANAVHARGGVVATELRLDPGSSAEVSLPAAALPRPCSPSRARPASGPSAHVPGNRDVRWLGVYLTWSDAPRARGAALRSRQKRTVPPKYRPLKVSVPVSFFTS